MTWLSLALALVQLVNFVIGKLDEEGKKQALLQLWRAQTQQLQDEVIGRANAARDAALARAAANPGSVRDPNRYSRT